MRHVGTVRIDTFIMNEFAYLKGDSPMEWHNDDFKIVDYTSAVDIETVYRLLHETYWANMRTKETVAACVEHALRHGTSGVAFH